LLSNIGNGGSMTRIFKVEFEHTKYSINWSSRNVKARTASEAIVKASALEYDAKFGKKVRAVGVELVAEGE
jgi:hypothetical protein